MYVHRRYAQRTLLGYRGSNVPVKAIYELKLSKSRLFTQCGINADQIDFVV